MEIIKLNKKPFQYLPPRRESLLSQTQKLLRRAGLRARKGLAQHFLVDREVLGLLVSAAQITPGDFVIEVGPGLGTLTTELAKKSGQVVAVELDEKMIAIVERELAPFRNVTIIKKDVLTVAPEVLLREAGIEKPSRGYKVVANLPYYITSPVLRHFLEAKDKPQSMVVMVQKEVAEEITAKPGKMSLLSVGVQFYGEPEIVSYVPSGSFYPAPEVDSAILRIIPYSRQVVEENETEGFFSLVRAGFGTARKQLGNSLALGLELPKEEALSLLAGAQIIPKRRAETLTLEEWARLWRVYSEVGY
ncbi:16S rRNA (adenine(1518)-N(6)/adenine(1519)-N(6))-dimethyltransferase RsmA [Chloroflexota bacterium]